MSDNGFEITDTTTDPGAVLNQGIERLRELKEFHAQAVGEQEKVQSEGREKVAALQAEVDSDNARQREQVADAAEEFNAESSKLVETGFATPKGLASLGLGSIRVPKR